MTDSKRSPPGSGSVHGMLREVQRLATTGARAVEPYVHAGVQYLAVPQLACDHPGQPAAMTAGNSDVDLMIYRWQGDAIGYVEHQRLPVPGGEDAEFFSIGERCFLATASLRAGSGPYVMDISSTVYELRGDRFEPFQSFETYAAKQWTHFTLGEEHFLALAQGVPLPGVPLERNRRSVIHRWNGQRFEPHQEIPSAWGYNWLALQVGGEQLLAYADHIEPTRLMRWNGRLFEPFQRLEGVSGRAFCAFQSRDQHWLACAHLHDDSLLYRWDGRQYVRHQVLSEAGGRELVWLPSHTAHGADRLVQVNFIHGTREAPQPALDSVIYAWQDDHLETVDTFATSGGTDAAVYTHAGRRYLAVSNSLSAEVRYRADTVIYEITGG